MDGVLVSVPAAKGIDVLREAAAVGIRNMWVQNGGESAELIIEPGKWGALALHHTEVG